MCLIPKKRGLEPCQKPPRNSACSFHCQAHAWTSPFSADAEIANQALGRADWGIPGSDGPIWLPLSSDVDAAI